MPYITYSSGLTIKSPTRGTRNYEATMRTDTYQKISEHDHTGSGRGIQLGAGAVAADAINDTKIRLRNAQYLRSRNAADSADINILRVDANDQLQIGANIHIIKTLALANNTTTTLGLQLSVTTVIGASIFYSVKRVGTSTIVESGTICLVYNGTSWELSLDRVGDAGISFTIAANGTISYTTSNQAGHVSSNIYLLALTTGV